MADSNLLILTDKEYNILEKIAKQSGMDCWFTIGCDNSYIYDMEESQDLSLRDGIGMLTEGMTDYKDYNMSQEEIQTFEALLKKLDIKS